MSLPFKLFEAGDCIILDNTTDTGSRNIRKLAAVYTDEISENKKNSGIFSIIHGALDIVMKKCHLQFTKDYTLEKSSSPFYFPGQQFNVLLKGKNIGSLGVVHPDVLKNFNWMHPTVMWELDIFALEDAFTKSYN